MNNVTIALDAMGGDHAPASVMEGAALAIQHSPQLSFLLFGDQEKLAPLLAQFPAVAARSVVTHTEHAVGPHDKPSAVVRTGRNTSMWLAIQAVKEGRAAGVVSAGNTGALMAVSKIILKTIPGIARPAIAGLIPTTQRDCVMLDLGANIDCDAEILSQFAIMGDAFARAVLSIKTPRIGLLNVGSEDMKGHEAVKNASILIRAMGDSINFHGFVEGDDIGKGTVDVVVTDGFTGNIALKTAEGTARMISHYLKRSLCSSLLARIGAAFAWRSLKELKNTLDPRKYNGAMFLGLNGIVVKSHGGTDAFGFSRAILVAAGLAEYNINQRIGDELRVFEMAKKPTLEAAEI